MDGTSQQHDDIQHDIQPNTGVIHYPTRFGRGWIPAGRDIGVGADALGQPNSGRPELVEGPSFSSEHSGGSEGESSPSTSSGRTDEGVGEDLAAPAVRHDGWTPVRKARFLDHLAQHGNVRGACGAVGMSPEAAYKLRRREALFAQGWAAALIVARAHVEQVLADRAIDGVTEPIFYRGEQVGARVRFDSRLLLAHLARLDQAAGAAPAGLGERFDELVAMVAGEWPEAEMFAVPSDTPGETDMLPMTREAYAARAEEHAEHAAAEDVPDDDFAEEYDPDADWDEREEDDRRIDRIWGAGWRAGCAAEAAWDAWQARAFAAVDGLAGEGGLGEAATLPASALPASANPFHHPADGPSTRAGEGFGSAHPEPVEGPVEFKSLDPANSVNFASSVRPFRRYTFAARP